MRSRYRMRPEEIFELVWRDVDREKGIVIKGENTKIETERIVGITPRLKRELETLSVLAPTDPES